MDGGIEGKLIIFSAPSGAGKTTIVKRVMERFPQLEFSVSATSRNPRPHETHGTDYYFLTAGDFEKAVSGNLFAEWEEVYDGIYYGTLLSELKRIWTSGKAIAFDVDVKGGLNLKRTFGDNALAVFVMPPSVDTLRERLTARCTENESEIEQRIAKAEYEISFAGRFDYVLVNDDLEKATKEIEQVVAQFLNA